VTTALHKIAPRGLCIVLALFMMLLSLPGARALAATPTPQPSSVPSFAATASAATAVLTAVPSASPTGTPTATPLPAVPSPYLLPYPGGTSYLIQQGNNGNFSHTGYQRYAWDFGMPMGSLILAAREGRVSFVDDSHTTGGDNYTKYASEGNYIAIDHGDGTTALYLHLMYDGALVKVGDRVKRGAPIAYSGRTGFATGPHLHFQVQRTDPGSYFSQSIPTTFADVTSDGGVPQYDKSYTSGNGPVPAGVSARNTTTTASSAAVSGARASMGNGGGPPQVVTPDARYISDLSMPDGLRVYAQEKLVKRWRLTNSGTIAWPAGTTLRKVDGTAGFESDPVAMGSIQPGTTADVTVVTRAPAATGDQQAVWQLTDNAGNQFGDRLWLRVQVIGMPPTVPVANSQLVDGFYNAQTGHNVSGAFARFYNSHGGVDMFGYARTEAFTEGDLTVQYFQRARFEMHPENAGTPFDVQLMLLGDTMTSDQRPFTRGTPFTSGDSHRYYTQTGHGVHFAFLHYFDTHGGIDNFGYPTSEEFSLATPRGPLTVQYFQRARFEYHPEHLGTPYEVQLGLLGDDYLTQRGWLPVPAGGASPSLPVPAARAQPQATAGVTTKTPDNGDPKQGTAPKTVTVNVDNLNVRSDGSYNASVIGGAVRGDQLTVAAQGPDGWLKVLLPGTTDSYGWVDSSFIARS